MGLTAEEIKALPRTEEGIFDLSGLAAGRDVYAAAREVYTAYAAFETNQNKKEGYPDIMAQMRAWNRKAEEDFTSESAAGYLSMLLSVIGEISPEIYENYRELADMFWAALRRALEQFYDEGASAYAGSQEAAKLLRQTIAEACEMDVLLAEKYEKYIGEEA